MEVIAPQAAARSREPGLNLDNLDMPEPQQMSVEASLQLSINYIFSLPVLEDKEDPKEGGCPIPGNIQVLAEWGSEHPCLMEYVPAHYKHTRWPSQTKAFYDSKMLIWFHAGKEFWMSNEIKKLISLGKFQLLCVGRDSI